MADYGIRIKIELPLGTQEVHKLIQKYFNENPFRITISGFDKQFEQVKNQVNQIKKEIENINQITTTKTTKSILSGEGYRDLQKRVDEIRNSTDKYAKVIIDTEKNTGKLKQAVIEYTDSVGRAVKETMKWITTTKQMTDGTILTENKFTTTGFKFIDDIKKAQNYRIKLQDQENAEYLRGIKLREQAELALRARKAKLQEEENAEFLRGIKLKERELLNQQKLQERLTLFQKQAQIDVTKFRQQYAGLYDENRLNAFMQKVQQLTPSTKNLAYQLQLLNKEFGQIKADAIASGLNTANKSAISLGEAIHTAANKFSIWIGVSTLVMSAIHKVQESFDFIVDVSRQFTNLQMEMTQQKLVFSDITKQAYEYASAMGSTTDAVMQAIAVFGTYTSTMDQVLQKSRAAIILSNITGQTVEQSANQIMAVLSQFKLGSEDAMKVVDLAGSVARQLQVDYPIAVREISMGIRTVGNVAKEAGMSLEETSSVVGTVMEKTRRSGTEVGEDVAPYYGNIVV